MRVTALLLDSHPTPINVRNFVGVDKDNLKWTKKP